MQTQDRGQKTEGMPVPCARFELSRPSFIAQSLRIQAFAEKPGRKCAASFTLIHYMQNTTPHTPVDSSPSTHQSQQYQQPLR